MTGEELKLERDKLLAEHHELEEAHDRLRHNPHDHEEHRAHADRLRRHIQRLHTFIDALRTSLRAEPEHGGERKES